MSDIQGVPDESAKWREELKIKYTDGDYPHVRRRQGIELEDHVLVDAVYYNAIPATQWGIVVHISDGDASPYPFKVSLKRSGVDFGQGQFSFEQIKERRPPWDGPVLEMYVHSILAARCEALEKRMAELVEELSFASSEAIRGTIALQHIAHAGSESSKVKTLDDVKRIATEALTA